MLENSSPTPISLGLYVPNADVYSISEVLVVGVEVIMVNTSFGAETNSYKM